MHCPSPPPRLRGKDARSGNPRRHRHGAASRAAAILPLLWVGCTYQEAHFCPQDGCADFLIHEISAASASVHVAIAYFSHAEIAGALIDAHERGVDVRVLTEADASATSPYQSTIRELLAAGIPVLDDTNPGLMHHKFCVIDENRVLTGSFNYTDAADTTNNENLVLLSAPSMADAYEREFESLWETGVPPAWYP